MNLWEALWSAASVRLMATDSLPSYERVCRDVRHRFDQVNAGLLSVEEAARLIREG